MIAILNPHHILSIVTSSNSLTKSSPIFADFTQLAGVFSEPICICIFVILRLYFLAKVLISSIFSCQIPNDDIHPQVLICLKSAEPTHGLSLTHSSPPGNAFPYISS